jgi:small GTP-binding protein
MIPRSWRESGARVIVKKVCMVGAYGVGKTSLVRRFVDSIFSDKYLTTVGVKIDKKQIRIGEEEVTLMLWDLAGEDAVTEIRLSHLRGASAYILVADGTRSSTLDTALDLRKRVRDALGPVPGALVVNKTDLKDTWEIRQDSLDKLSAEGWPVLMSSAKTGEGVQELFLTVAEKSIG